MDRKTILTIIITAALTAVGAEAVKSWVPSAASYAWNSLTKSEVIYLSVVFGGQAKPVNNAEVTAFDASDEKKSSRLLRQTMMVLPSFAI